MRDLVELAGDIPKVRNKVIGRVELIGRPRLISIEKSEINEKKHPESTAIFREEIARQAPEEADSYVVGGEVDFRSERHPFNKDCYTLNPTNPLYLTLAVQYCKRL